jgi:hypothetical protein
MWNDFTDFELAELAGCYGIEDELEFCNDLTLSNRAQIETLLTLVEHNMAFEE